jgi:hypothetical protein
MMFMSLSLIGCTEQFVAPYNPTELQNAQGLLKKEDTLFLEIAEAQRASAQQPKSAAAQKSLSFSSFQEEWNDSLSDADVIVQTACAEPHNGDTCTVAQGLYQLLTTDEQQYESGLPGLADTTIYQRDVQHQTHLLIADESSKELLSGQGSSAGSSAGSGSASSGGKAGSVGTTAGVSK